MKTLTVINSISKIPHEITFSSRPSSPGKLVILQDGRAIGKINKVSRLIFCEQKDVYTAIENNIESIIKDN